MYHVSGIPETCDTVGQGERGLRVTDTGHTSAEIKAARASISHFVPAFRISDFVPDLRKLPNSQSF
jgi:hypothetical protein